MMSLLPFLNVRAPNSLTRRDECGERVFTFSLATMSTTVPCLLITHDLKPIGRRVLVKVDVGDRVFNLIEGFKKIDPSAFDGDRLGYL